MNSMVSQRLFDLHYAEDEQCSGEAFDPQAERKTLCGMSLTKACGDYTTVRQTFLGSKRHCPGCAIADTFAGRWIEARALPRRPGDATVAFYFEKPNGRGFGSPIYFRGPANDASIVVDAVAYMPRLCWEFVESKLLNVCRWTLWRRTDRKGAELDVVQWCAELADRAELLDEVQRIAELACVPHRLSSEAESSGRYGQDWGSFCMMWQHEIKAAGGEHVGQILRALHTLSIGRKPTQET